MALLDGAHLRYSRKSDDCIVEARGREAKCCCVDMISVSMSSASVVPSGVGDHTCLMKSTPNVHFRSQCSVCYHILVGSEVGGVFAVRARCRLGPRDLTCTTGVVGIAMRLHDHIPIENKLLRSSSSQQCSIAMEGFIECCRSESKNSAMRLSMAPLSPLCVLPPIPRALIHLQIDIINNHRRVGVSRVLVKKFALVPCSGVRSCTSSGMPTREKYVPNLAKQTKPC